MDLQQPFGASAATLLNHLILWSTAVLREGELLMAWWILVEFWDLDSLEVQLLPRLKAGGCCKSHCILYLPKCVGPLQ